MGIKDLISKIFPEELKVKSTFEILRNKTMGVDVSNYMFKLITTRDNLVRDFHYKPRLDTSPQIVKFWDSFKKICDRFGIKLVLVLDGRRNTAKIDTNKLREAMRAATILKLDELLQNANIDDSEKVLKLQKSTMFIPEDMLYAIKTWAAGNEVTCVLSLYEADAGLLQLEDMGTTDGTISEDGYFFPLDSKLWATKVSIARGILVAFNSENVRTALAARLSPSSDTIMTADHGRVLSVLLGSDFLPRPVGFGPKTVEKFIATWMISSNKENTRSLMEIKKGKKRKIGGSETENADAFPNYFNRFWLAFNIFKHPPVFKFTSLAEGSW
jgi:nucleoside 2-deoxyribosyltransferase